MPLTNRATETASAPRMFFREGFSINPINCVHDAKWICRERNFHVPGEVMREISKVADKSRKDEQSDTSIIWAVSVH